MNCRFHSQGIVGAFVSLWLASLPIPGAFCDTAAPARVAYGVDYSKPEKYQVAGTQTSLSREEWDRIGPELPFPVDLAALGKLYAWKASWFRSVSGGGRYVGRHTVQDLVRERTLTGCHDHGLVVAAVLRRCGVPAVFVEATGIDWALEYPERTQSFRGHVFVEVFLDNAWILLDSVTGEYVANYDPLNPLLPLPKPNDPRGFFVLFKGLDPANYGISRIEELNQAQAASVHLIRSKVQDFCYPPYQVRPLPCKDGTRPAPDAR